VYETVGELFWTERNFISPQAMLQDRYFFDSDTQQYTPDRWVDYVEARYGGVDSVLLWITYPTLGLDNRNQFDMHEVLPGGLEGLKSLINGLQARGVKALLPLNPWDMGTRPVGKTQAQAMARLLLETNADGFNGDTMGFINSSFWNESVALDHPAALEPEGGGDLATLAWTKMGWDYWQWSENNVPVVKPPVGVWHWMERKHRSHPCDRWATNHTTDLHFGFFNGLGFVSWQNVWGIYNGMSDHDAALTRRTASILRFVPGVFSSERFEPYTLEGLQWDAGVFASRFVNDSALHLPGATRPTPTGGNNNTVWVLVNRYNAALPADTPQLQVEQCSQFVAFYDLYHGVQLQPSAGGGGSCVLSFGVEALGIGAVLGISQSSDPPEGLTAFLAAMSSMTVRDLATFGTDPTWIQQTMLAEPAAPVRDKPDGYVAIQGGAYTLNVSGIEIEGGEGFPVDCQFPWETLPQRNHFKEGLTVEPVFLKATPVTNAEYLGFLNTTTPWVPPHDDTNWLKQWNVSDPASPIGRTFPPGAADWPVVYVSRDDSAAYCASSGHRLPTDIEWQFTAQNGQQAQLYPWGSRFNASCVSPLETGPTLPNLDSVFAHPCGRTATGVWDMMGNTWEWTSEFHDEHTRSALVRGGSKYRSSGSKWYLPQPRNNLEHQRLLLMSDSHDRNAMVGFRCAVPIDSTADLAAN
jgi:formylglycine-generating enzyme required for sulfatase activity